MNSNEIKSFMEHIRRSKISNLSDIIEVIKSNSYSFNQNEIVEIFSLKYPEIRATPDGITELIASIGKSFSPKSVIDICCGTGNLLKSFTDLDEVKGIDSNFEVIQLAKYLNPKIEFVVENSLEFGFDSKKYDLVIGGPPFGAKTTGNKSLEVELFRKGLSILSKNGVAIFIVSEGLLMNLSTSSFRQEILSDFALDMVISLPIGVFYPFSKVKTSILVVRNGKPIEKVFMPQFEDNSSEIIENFKNKKGSFYVLSLDIKSRFDRDYYDPKRIISSKNFNSFINKKFQHQRRPKLETLIKKVKIGEIIPEGTLVLKPFGASQLKVEISENDTANKNIFIPLILNDLAESENITPNYLHWFLSLDKTKEYLSSQALGTVFLSIPKPIIYSLPIPAPKHNFIEEEILGETVITKKNESFKKLFNQFYSDYDFNLKKGNYNTANILAGAITEAILYQTLLDNGFDKNLLQNDKNLGLGKLISYFKEFNLVKKIPVPMTHIEVVRKKRNSAIHISGAVKKDASSTKPDFNDFNKVISYFGI